MTAHVVSFTPAGAPTRAVCSQCGELKVSEGRSLAERAEDHAYAQRGTIEFAGLPRVGRAS